MPGTDLLLFAELQRQRLQAALVSTTPRQTFTSRPQATVYTHVPAARREYVSSPRGGRPRRALVHGTLHGYQRYGCRCERCCAEKRRYHQRYKAQALASYQSYATSVMEEM